MTDAPGAGSDDGWSRWHRDDARRAERTLDTVASPAAPAEDTPGSDVYIWDTWLLRDRNGAVSTIDGWQVAFSLTATKGLLPGERHDVAEIRYFYSADGQTWHDGGPVFADALGQRQWAGSALYDDGSLYLYYTAAGDDDAAETTYSQRIAVGHGGTVRTDAAGVDIEGPWTHEVLLRPGGEWYETQTQSKGMIYTFRDPWFFEDPDTEETYLLFEANTPVADVPPDEDTPEDATAREFNGCVGVAVSETGDPLSWDLQPPLLDAVRVNQELERPHVVVHGDSYYLFVSSHVHTFAPGIVGYDGLYGFVADAIRGEYRPLNGSGLVVTNPPETPYQAYSWMAFSHSGELFVQSFLNYYDFGGESLDDIAELPAAEQRRRFAGTLAPTLRVAVDGARTRIVGELPAWRIPRPDERLPPPSRIGDPPRLDERNDERESRGRQEYDYQ
ncbi:MAG: glycoside hydrolase family 68 protein [Halorubrum sp.]